MIDIIEEIELLNSELNNKWSNYIKTREFDISNALDELKDLLGIIDIRDDISYDSKRKNNIIESKKLYAANAIINDNRKLNNISDIELSYSTEYFILEYIKEDNKHIMNYCFFENEDLYIREYTLNKLIKDLDTTIELLQVYSMLECLMYFYLHEYKFFNQLTTKEEQDNAFEKQKDKFEDKLTYTKRLCDIIKNI